ncbi:MAG TPA: hypothetical protein VLE73_00220 [Candidatus Saccharimonadales bacterium]|nr:hypothetical protein [Candidatus Saccharimonadales bacterium]
MQTNGVAVADFSERIGNNGHVANAWPFADLTPTEYYETNIPRLTPGDGVAVGRVVLANNRGAVFEVLRDVDRDWQPVLFDFDNPQTSLAWGQLAGITLAVAVRAAGVSPSRRLAYHPEKVLAIEPPLTHPEYIRTARLSLQAGYLHGVVGGATATYRSGSQGPVQLEVAGFEQPLTLLCRGNAVFNTSGAQKPQNIRGDIIRTEITRPGTKLLTYLTKNAIYTIGHRTARS